MKLKPTVMALSMLAAVSSVSAMTVAHIGPATVTCDETTTLGFLSGSFSSGNNDGFSWTLPNSAQVVSFGPTADTLVNLPSFTLAKNMGWNLSGAVKAFLGNPSFTEINGATNATTNIFGTADISVNGGPAATTSGLVGFTITTISCPFVGGYFLQAVSLPVCGFTSRAQSNATLNFSASGGTFSTINSNPQNKLEFSFTAMSVPEPETAAMLLSGRATLGWLARRRRSA